MKKLSSLFAAVAMAAMLTPAISMAQDTPQDPTPAPQEQQVKAVGFGVPVQACTTDGFSDEAVLGVIASADEVTAAGGADSVFTDDVKAAAQQELAAAWKAVIGGLTSAEMGKDAPSDQFKASVKEHLKTVQDDLAAKTHVHLLVVPLQITAPTEGCPVPAAQ
jgi:hypothetical protein